MEDEEWESEYGYLEPQDWRKNLLSILKLISDMSLQEAVLVDKDEDYDFDPPFTDFEIWFDINAYYMNRLNLEDGFEHAKKEKFLTAAECERLRPMDAAFREFLPDNLITPDASPILESSEWKEIISLAKKLIDSGFLK